MDWARFSTTRWPSPSRRHVMALAVVAAVSLAGAVAVVFNPKEYVASATLVIVAAPSIPEREFTTHTTIDPTTRSWLANYNDPTVVADIFAKRYQGRTKRAELRAAGVTGELVVLTKPSVASVESGHGPVVVLIVISDDPVSAVGQIDIAVDDFVGELSDEQAGYDPTMMVTVAVAAASTQATLVSGSRARSAVGFLLTACLFGAMANAAIGRVQRRRRAHECAPIGTRGLLQS